MESEIAAETSTSTQRTECKNNDKCKPINAKDDVKDQQETEMENPGSEEVPRSIF